MTIASPSAVSLRERRGFIAVPLLSSSAWLAGCAIGNGSAEKVGASGADDRWLAFRLANRATWGATDADVEAVVRLGLRRYIEQQTAPPSLAPLPAAAQAQIDALSVHQRSVSDLMAEMETLRRAADTPAVAATAAASDEARRAAQQAYQQGLTRLAREAGTRHLLRALYSPDQLHEQMAWFWFNHFNVHQFKGAIRAMVGDFEERAIRPQALGSFRRMLGAVTRHPAMLRYLDNDQNAVGRINENHARELLELHTLGGDGGYSQRDVQELARVLTGHGVNLGTTEPRLRPEQQALYVRDGVYEFNPARHDFGDKTLLGHLIKGRGAAELEEVLDILAAHPSTARLLARKAAQFLVADDPPPALVAGMSAAFTAAGGRIGPALAVALRAPESGAAGSAGQFKDPMHFVISALRAAYGDRVILNTAPIQNWLTRLGQGLYNRATPDGYPMNAGAWNGSGQMATRFEIARAIGSGSAGLFKPEDTAMGAEQPAFPQLARPLYYTVVRSSLRPPTRQALDAAGSPQDWNTLYLASPDFMFR